MTSRIFTKFKFKFCFDQVQVTLAGSCLRNFKSISLSRRHLNTMPNINQNQTLSCFPTITISVDGNISSGKSTLVSSLKELFPKNFNVPVELIPEPLEKWTNLNGHNLLGMFYEDPEKHNFMFQHYVQLTRLVETIKTPQHQQGSTENQKGAVRIMERSLQNNRYVFTELAKRDGRLQPEEFAVLSEWHNWMVENFDLNLDLIIYLRTSPETVFNRMKGRGRTEESTVPLKYLQNLHESYEDWLTRRKTDCSGDPTSPKKRDKLKMNSSNGSTDNGFNGNRFNQRIIVIDANQGKEEVALECQRLIRNFMNDIGFNLQKANEEETRQNGNVPNKKPRKEENVSGESNIVA